MTTHIETHGAAVAAAGAAGAVSASLEWWRTAVIYQIYPRSFADANGDGIGDLPGITSRLEAVRDLGADAIWLSPFFTSPQNDAGYDVADYCDVDPIFGTLADFDVMIARARELRLRVIIDLVPNHSSSEHVWFQQALAAPEGSAERARYIFRDGAGDHGELPPNDWQSCFGGSAWTRTTRADGTLGQWYLHLFDSSQPDFDWSNPWVREQFVDILRFWLDRGVDGFRVDVAHGMVKEHGLPNYIPTDTVDFFAPSPHWAQEGVHEIFREWRAVVDEYEGDRILCAEAWVNPLTSLANWVRPDEMHHAFNFAYLSTPWAVAELRGIIQNSLNAFSAVGAPSTWVLSNHDVVRLATRYGFAPETELYYGIGPTTPGLPDPALALRRGRAASMLMLALPGSAYLYQGEELGLPEAIDIPDDARQDPAWHRTSGERYGRDGCRVPLPWVANSPAFGFNTTGESWLPQPAEWSALAHDRQLRDPASTLTLYRTALNLRRALGLGAGSGSGTGTIAWLDLAPDALAFTNGEVLVIANLGAASVALPVGYQVILSSDPSNADSVAPDSTVWAVSA